MTTILQINSAARSQGANSTLLVNELTEKLQLWPDRHVQAPQDQV